MRESRLSGSVEGVMGNHDSYSDLHYFDVFQLSCGIATRARVHRLLLR
jgi:hypothetical protein